MLGVTDKLKKCLETEVFETEEDGRKFMDIFLDEQNISKKGYREVDQTVPQVHPERECKNVGKILASSIDLIIT